MRRSSPRQQLLKEIPGELFLWCSSTVGIDRCTALSWRRPCYFIDGGFPHTKIDDNFPAKERLTSHFLFLLFLVLISFTIATSWDLLTLACAPLAIESPSHVSVLRRRSRQSHILSTCLITMALCVWAAVHLNILEYSGGKKQKWRKLGSLIIGLFAPRWVELFGSVQAVGVC